MHVQAVFIPFIFVRMEEKGKILIIDDNKDVLFALNLLLEPYMQKVKVTTQPARIEYFMRTFQPVSYTHLDVYKRQPFKCSGLMSIRAVA